MKPTVQVDSFRDGWTGVCLVREGSHMLREGIPEEGINQEPL
jgi:hypothetical protein